MPRKTNFFRFDVQTFTAAMSSPPTIVKEDAAASPDDGTITVRSMTSSSKGDFRRTSFILTAVQNALNNFGVTSKQIFQGGRFYRVCCYVFLLLHLTIEFSTIYVGDVVL